MKIKVTSDILHFFRFRTPLYVTSNEICPCHQKNPFNIIVPTVTNLQGKSSSKLYTESPRIKRRVRRLRRKRRIRIQRNGRRKMRRRMPVKE